MHTREEEARDVAPDHRSGENEEIAIQGLRINDLAILLMTLRYYARH